jgi:sodium transport system ATP-binding protein
MIEVLGVRRRIGAALPVDGVGFTAADGRVTGLLGPNGAGKTTTLRLIAGLLRPQEGEVRIDGVVVGEQPLRARARLGVLPDEAGLYQRLTVREHLAYSAALQGLRGPAAAHAIERVAALLGLEPLLERRAAGFSRGERQRLALGRALVHDPPNLLLDEPTNGLDVAANRALRATIRALAREGRCVVVSSHVMQDVAALCDDVVVLKSGRVLTEGTPAALQARAGAASFEEAFLALLGGGEGVS